MYNKQQVLGASLAYFEGDELAASTWMNKYALTNYEGQYLELTPDDMHRRMAREFARIEDNYEFQKEYSLEQLENLSDYGKTRAFLTEEGIYGMFKGFGQVIPQGSVMASLGTDTLASLSNCFFNGHMEDNINSIFDTAKTMAQVGKRRGGTSTDLSYLRPRGAVIHNSANESSGAVGFLDLLDVTGKLIGQAGRKMAMMVTMDINHPDIMEFISIKRDLSKVTSANLSIKISDEFMKAVENDEDYILRFPCDIKVESIEDYWDEPYNKLRTIAPNQYIKRIRAKEYWDEIIKSAHGTAEPGLLFWDNVLNYGLDSVYPDYKPMGVNPCFRGDMRILTVNGYKTFKELEDLEVDLINKDGEVVSGKVWSNGIKEVYEVSTWGGKKIYCTKDHKFMTVNGEVVEAKDLKGKRLMVYDSTRKAPKVRNVKYVSNEEVFDFNLQDDTHWGVVEGVIAHNCSELTLSKSDSCRLIAINLFDFVVNPFHHFSYFDFDKFYEVVYETQRLGDDLVDLEIEYVQRIIDKIKNDTSLVEDKESELKLWEEILHVGKNGRRTGIGFTALGDTLAALGLKYDSDEAINATEEILEVKMGAELDCTIDLAILRGSFVGWDRDEEFGIKMDSRGESVYGRNSLYDFLLKKFPQQTKRMFKYGRRNVSFSTVAPTGTVSMMTKTTSGIEPLFLPFYIRRRKVNTSDERVDFVDKLGGKWKEFAVLHHKFKDWIEGHSDFSFRTDPQGVENLPKEELQKYFEQSPWYGSTANDINWVKRVKIQSISQLFISHSISSTINLPSTVTEEEVSEIYFEAWKQGLKGVTVYRDGSRSGVLVTDTEKKQDFLKNTAPKRPKTLPATVVRFNNNHDKWVAFVGLYDNQPYEIFTGLVEGLGLPNGVINGEIIKSKQDGKSIFTFKSGDYEIEVSNAFNPEYWNYAKLISGVLRHGMSLPKVINTIEGLNLDGSHLNTWKVGIQRALKTFIVNEDVEDRKCPNPDCGDPDGLIMEEGCMKCKSCGYSKC